MAQAKAKTLTARTKSSAKTFKKAGSLRSILCTDSAKKGLGLQAPLPGETDQGVEDLGQHQGQKYPVQEPHRGGHIPSLEPVPRPTGWILEEEPPPRR